MESKMNYSLIIKNIRHIKRSSPEFNNKQARPSDAVMEISKYLTLKHYYPNPNNPFLFHHAYSNFRYLKFVKRYKVKKIRDIGCKITAIDCGQGDSFLIENKGEYGLIDFGGDKGKVEKFLRYNLNKPLKYAVLTHLHKDHMGDFVSIVKNYPIDEIFIFNTRNESPLSTEEANKYNIYEKIECSRIHFISTSDIAENNFSFNIGNAKFTFLSPTMVYNKDNDNSLVLLMEYQNKKVLFTGDISTTVEEDILEHCMNHNIDLSKTSVLKVAHHGSRFSSSENFLSNLNKQFISVISCGEVNRYNHPHNEAVARLKKYGEVFMTDEMGNISLSLKKHRKTQVVTERETLFKESFLPSTTNNKSKNETSKKIGNQTQNKNLANKTDKPVHKDEDEVELAS